MLIRFGPSRATLLLAAACIVFAETPALAYVDPATSGLTMQILTPVLIALATFWRSIKARLKALFAWLGNGSGPRGGD